MIENLREVAPCVVLMIAASVALTIPIVAVAMVCGCR